MKYRVTEYSKGRVLDVSDIRAKTHREAAKKAGEWSKWASHFVVEGKKTKFIGKNLKELTGELKVFRSCENYTPVIIVMIGNVSEIHTFKDKDAQEKKYKEVECILSTHVESAKVRKEQIDITVSSEETSGSENGLMSKKTLNGSVTSAIWKVLRTPTNTARSSGSDSAKNTAGSTWKIGSNPSPSKPSQTLFAKFLKEPSHIWADENGYKDIWISEFQEGMVVKLEQWQGNWYKWHGYKVHISWVKPVDKFWAKVSENPSPSSNEQIHFVPEMNKYKGGIYYFKKYTYYENTYCAQEVDSWESWNFSGEWLEPVEEPKKPAKSLNTTSNLNPYIEEDIEKAYKGKEEKYKYDGSLPSSAITTEELDKSLKKIERISKKFKYLTYKHGEAFIAENPFISAGS